MPRGRNGSGGDAGRCSKPQPGHLSRRIGDGLKTVPLPNPRTGRERPSGRSDSVTDRAWRDFCDESAAVSGRPPRLVAFSYVGCHRYSLTFCVHRRKQIFTEAALVHAMLEQISRAAADWRFAVLAYCFMPDHLHLLIEAQGEDADFL